MSNTQASYKNAVSRIVCWKCQRGGQKGDSPLRKVGNGNYVCENDLQWGAPEAANISEIMFQREIAVTQDEIQKILKPEIPIAAGEAEPVKEESEPTNEQQPA